ncbi:MAG: hypothetical protein PHF17_11245 [Arcobacteraceae bacterium]|nr:hypothetical protein [Arcobacteraceae bacterium]
MANQECEEIKEDEWYTSLQVALCKENIDFEEIFKTHAEELMSQYALTNEKETFLFKEIEYYFYDETRHPDPYVHGSCKQKFCGEYYYHYSGLDITFGNGNYSGGILIRGISKIVDNKEEEEPIFGPKNSLKRMLCSKLNGGTYKYSDKNTQGYCIKVCKLKLPLKNITLFSSVRFGLYVHEDDLNKDYFKNPQEIPFILRKYRFFTTLKALAKATKKDNTKEEVKC